MESEPHITRPNCSEDEEDESDGAGCTGALIGLAIGFMLGVVLPLIFEMFGDKAIFYWEDHDSKVVSQQGRLYKLVPVDREYKVIDGQVQPAKP